MLETPLNVVTGTISLNSLKNLMRKILISSPFTDEDTEGQRSEVTCYTISGWAGIQIQDWFASRPVSGVSLVVHLPMQETQVRALVQEYPTCHGAAKLMHHNCRAHALEPLSSIHWANVPRVHALQQERSHRSEKSMHCHKEKPLLTTTRESPHAAMKTQWSQK